jgi:hypothetical protein
MNAFVEHHKDSIQFRYRCFDRILLNGLIQPFQQPQRVLGFFNTYREGKRVTRKTLTEIADQFQDWLKNRAEKWGAPILEVPEGNDDESRRNEFVETYFRDAEPGQVVAIVKAREPARILGEPIQLLRQRSSLGPDVRAPVSLLPVFRKGLPEPAPLGWRFA